MVDWAGSEPKQGGGGGGTPEWWSKGRGGIGWDSGIGEGESVGIRVGGRGGRGGRGRAIDFPFSRT